MSTCGTVYVVLGERPELDRLELCQRDRMRRGTGLADRCAEHAVHLGWVDADPARLDAYREQVRQYQRQQQAWTAIQEAKLL